MMTTDNTQIEISLKDQKLFLKNNGEVNEIFNISTAANGPGEKQGSECTPRGRHFICEKIGNKCSSGTVFVAREPTGEIFNVELHKKYPGRDWMLTRILRLAGKEEGINRGGDVDTSDRMIYIHGTPDDIVLGMPGSHGCIRMNNEDVMKLFEMVEINTEVNILE